jgi:hypothetical protein
MSKVSIVRALSFLGVFTTAAIQYASGDKTSAVATIVAGLSSASVFEGR